MDAERYGVDARESLFMSIHCVLHNGKDTEVRKKPPFPAAVPGAAHHHSEKIQMKRHATEEGFLCRPVFNSCVADATVH